jgi:hypothetical protein
MMENIRITAIEEELRNYQIILDGGIVNGIKIGDLGITRTWLQDQIFRCRKLQDKAQKNKPLDQINEITSS